MHARPPQYLIPDGVLVVLIRETVNGSPERRLAAKFILDCLRRQRFKDELGECIDELEHQSLLDIAAEARTLALSLKLIP